MCHTACSGPNSLEHGASIDAGIDDDWVDGGDGDDRIVGGEGNDSILGGAGNDTIFAGNDPDLGLDVLDIPDEDDASNPFTPDRVTDNGRDTVDGGSGNDVIYGADDADMLRGCSATGRRGNTAGAAPVAGRT